MTDTVATTLKVNTAIASPKLVKTKPVLGSGTLANVPFGCGMHCLYETYTTAYFSTEHVQAFSKAGDKNWKTFMTFYTNIIIALRDKPASILQTYRVAKNEGMPSIKPTYLCMQCPSIFAPEGMRGHWQGAKQHSFCRTHFVLGSEDTWTHIGV